MPSWQGKSRGNKLGYSIFVHILKTGGVLPAYFLLRFVTVYYYLFSYSSSKIIFDYFHRRIKFSRIRSLLKIYRNYYLLGQTVIDRIVLMADIPNRFSFDFDGEEELRRMVSKGQGGLLISAHIGNWEIAGHLLKRLNTPVNIVMYDGEHQRIKEYLEAITGKLNAKIIVIRNDISHIYAISDALRNNELVCIHADRFVEGNKTISASFLDAPALFPAGPFILATSFDVPVSFVFAMKETHLHYHFFASPLKYYRSPDKEIGIRQILGDFTAEMEKKIRKYPEQWYNYYNFWQENDRN